MLVYEDCSSDKGKADFSAGLRTLLVYELVYEQGDKGRAQATGLRTLLVYEDCSSDKGKADFSAGHPIRANNLRPCKRLQDGD